MSSATSAPPDPAFLALALSVLKEANRGTENAAPTPPLDAPEAPGAAAGGAAAEGGSAAASGRDSRGRFTRHNPGGPGNPFARRVARLRSTLLERVGEEDICAVVDRLLERARGGDVAAARLLLAYAVGKPAESVNPDTLDRQEWELYRQAPATNEEFLAVFGGLPLALACKFARLSLPLLQHQRAQELAQMINPPPAQPPASEGAKAPRRKRRKRPASEPTSSVGEPVLPPVPADGAGRPDAEPVAEPEPAVVLPLPLPPVPVPTPDVAGRRDGAVPTEAERAEVLPLPPSPVLDSVEEGGPSRTPAPPVPLPSRPVAAARGAGGRSPAGGAVAAAACGAAAKQPRPCAGPAGEAPSERPRQGEPEGTAAAQEEGLFRLLRKFGLLRSREPIPNGGKRRADGPVSAGEGG